MPIDEIIATIRRALSAGPTPGPWTVMPANAGEQCVARINAWEAVPPNGVELSHDSLDAAFIAACNPAAIAALLADRDEREAKLLNSANYWKAEHVAANAEIDRLTRERDEARAERDTLIDSVLHALDRAGVSDVADPGDAIDLLAADAKRYGFILNCEFIAARKYLPNLDEHEFKTKRIAHHDAQIEQERSEQAKEQA
jgi:hypothetical protein